MATLVPTPESGSMAIGRRLFGDVPSTNSPGIGEVRSGGRPMTVTVGIPTGIAAELEAATMGLVETAGVLLASIVETRRGVRLLARQMVWVEDSQYVEREASGLSIRSGGYVHALAHADKIG